MVKNIIIDTHVHIGKSEKSKISYTFPAYEELMLKEGIEKSVVMPNVSSIEKASKLNEEFMNNLDYENYRETFYPFIIVDPQDKESIEQISYYSGTICGVKYHPSISRAVVNSVSMQSIFEELKKYNIPMLVHCGRDRKSYIENLIKAAKNNKSINFIGAHMGGNATDLIEHAIDLLSEENLDNLYVDTSASKNPRLIKRGVDFLGKEKVIFGSDEPYSDLRVAKFCVDVSGISDKEKECVFNNNINNIITKF